MTRRCARGHGAGVVAAAVIAGVGCGGTSTGAPAGHGHGQGHGQAHGHGQRHGHGHGEGHDPLVHRFERADEWVDEFEGADRNAWQKPEHVVERMEIGAGMVVADIGAGTGYFLPYLSRAVGAGGKVMGLDIEPDMVRYMTERAARESLGNVEAKVVAGDDPGLAAGSVDRILIVDTWHHIPERSAYAVKLKQALRPGGALFVVDFTLESPHGPPAEHRLTADQVAEELRAAGFEAQAIDESLPHQYIVAAR